MSEHVAVASARELDELDELDENDAEDWTIPEDRLRPDAEDPWSVVIDDWAHEDEYRFPYPAGLP